MATRKLTVGKLKRIIRESLDDELNTVAVGDVVDVIGNEVDYPGVRVVRMVDDVEKETGVPNDPDDPHDRGFKGPGFVGTTEEGDDLVFPLSQVAPGSKMKGYFPHLGSSDTTGKYDDMDDYGRDVYNPYRRMARGFARDAVTPASHGPAKKPEEYFEDKLGEADEDHSDKHHSDPRWDDHADPTGRNWDSGLDD